MLVKFVLTFWPSNKQRHIWASFGSLSLLYSFHWPGSGSGSGSDKRDINLNNIIHLDDRTWLIHIQIIDRPKLKSLPCRCRRPVHPRWRNIYIYIYMQQLHITASLWLCDDASPAIYGTTFALNPDSSIRVELDDALLFPNPNSRDIFQAHFESCLPEEWWRFLQANWCTELVG